MAEGVLEMAFIPYYNQLMEILSTDEDLRKSSKGIWKQIKHTTYAGAVGGAISGGPLGSMLGAIAGAIVGYMLVDDYDSMITVLKNMSNSEKERLVQKVQEVVGGTEIEPLNRFIGNQAQREVLLQLIQGLTKPLKVD